jgi:hypothetical protein
MVHPIVKNIQHPDAMMEKTKMIPNASIAPWLSVSGHLRPWLHPIG